MADDFKKIPKDERRRIEKIMTRVPIRKLITNSMSMLWGPLIDIPVLVHLVHWSGTRLDCVVYAGLDRMAELEARFQDNLASEQTIHHCRGNNLYHFPKFTVLYNLIQNSLSPSNVDRSFFFRYAYLYMYRRRRRRDTYVALNVD